jgi:hypothetical protein
MLPIVAVLALTLNAPFACGLPRLAGDLGWTRGERLTYDIEALGASRQRGCALTARPAADRDMAIELSAEAGFSVPFFDFRGSARSSIDPLTLRPRRFHDQSNDGVLRTTDCDLGRPGLAVRVDWTSGKTRSMNAFVKGAGVLDLLSAIYYLRSADLAPGAAFCFDVVGGRRYWRLNGSRVGGTERIDTPAGSFQALRLEGVAVQADDASARYPMRLWISADARRLPVAFEAETGAGAVRGVLAGVAR